MSENDEDFVEVIKRGLDQDKIKDKWKGEFSGRQKFSERVEKRIAKGSSLGNRIAALCIPRVMQAMAVLFFEILIERCRHHDETTARAGIQEIEGVVKGNRLA